MRMRQRQEGFTLIEVLIGATVLAIMMALLMSALFTMTRTARAGESRLDELDSAQLVYAFLRRQLQNAFPLTERDDGAERVLFEGRAERLRFVGHLPLAEAGGIQFLELFVEDGALTMRYRDAWPNVPFAGSSAGWHVRTLLSDVRRVRYKYFGAHDDDSAVHWTTEWLEHDRLPEMIHVELASREGAQTTLAADVRVRTAVAQAALFRDRPRNAP